MIPVNAERPALPGFTIAAIIAALFWTQNLGAQNPGNGSTAVADTSVTRADEGPRLGSHPQLEQRYPRYVIQRQDQLSLSFPLSPELNQAVTVQPDGYINLQNGRSIHAQGLSVPEVVLAVKTAYSGVLHDPIVNVDVKDFQKPFYTVSGQVGKPGQYELRADITVGEAIAVAGGLAPTAKSQIFLFHRTSDQWFEVKKVNLKDMMQGKNVDENATLKPGDMIFVPETMITKFRKYVPYSLSAGSYLSNGSF